MAQEIVTLSKGGVAAADLSTKQYYAVKLGSSGWNVTSTLGTDGVVGILQNAPVSGGACSVALEGLSKAELGGTVTLGQPVTCSATGTIVASSDADEFVLGFAAEGGSSGEIIQIHLTHSGSVASVTGNVKYAEVTVTSAEILALNAAPKTLVAAPGAGYVHEFLSAVLILDYNSAAYANNGVLSIRETDASGTALSDTVALADFLAKTADHMVCVQALSADVALAANKALVLSMASGESISGDSPVRVKLAYRTHATGL